MISEKEVLDALHVLRDVCNKNNGECEKCILRNSGKLCGVIYDSEGFARAKISEIRIGYYIIQE